MNSTAADKRDELVKKVLDEIRRIAQETDIDIQKMPEQDIDRWVKQLVKRFWE